MEEKMLNSTFLRILIYIVILLFSFLRMEAQDNGNITCKEALEIIKSHEHDTSFVILDVRTESEYNEGHIRGSVLIDFHSPDFETEILKLNRDKTYLVYCKGGGRSAKAIELMKSNGFKNIHHLFEGIMQWEISGYEIVK